MIFPFVFFLEFFIFGKSCDVALPFIPSFEAVLYLEFVIDSVI